MKPTKFKIFTSTFLLVFFYFPKDLNGFINTCDGNSCAGKSRTDLHEFERLPLKRENRMVNVRDRVSAERLFNNRRTVDSDSKISEDRASRNFDFPRLVERTRQSRVCESRRGARYTNRLVEDRSDRDQSHYTQERVDRNIRLARELDRDRMVSRDNVEARNSRVENRNVRILNREDARVEPSRTRLTRDTRALNRDIRVQDRDVRVQDRDVRVQDRDARVERRSILVDRRIQTRNSRVDDNLVRVKDNTRRDNRDGRVELNARVMRSDRITRQDNRDLDRDSRMENRVNREVRDSKIRNRITREERNTRIENRDRTIRLSRNDQSSRTLNRDYRIQDRNDRVREDRNREQSRNIRVQNRDSIIENRDTRVEDRNNRVRNSREEHRNIRVQNRDSRIENRNTRVEDRVNTREQNREDRLFRNTRVSSNVNLRDTSRASENRLNVRASESGSSRRDVKQAQRTNEQRNIRIMGREVLDTNQKFVQRNVDVNNNRQIAERHEKANDKDRRFGNRDSRVREVDVRVGEYYNKNSDISQWSHVLTTTLGILLLMQIITSSNTKKFGIPQISHFLHGIKEKMY